MVCIFKNGIESQRFAEKHKLKYGKITIFVPELVDFYSLIALKMRFPCHCLSPAPTMGGLPHCGKSNVFNMLICRNIAKCNIFTCFFVK
jgi:hypothetical protein